jgi:hypothetical protein
LSISLFEIFLRIGAYKYMFDVSRSGRDLCKPLDEGAGAAANEAAALLSQNAEKIKCGCGRADGP